MPEYRPLGFVGSRRKLAIGASGIALVFVLGLCPMATRGVNDFGVTPSSTGEHRTYTTKFPRTENPLSEGGKWINGRTAALDFANVRSTPGLAWGTEEAIIKTAPGKYDDSVALLSGAWGPDQMAEATVHSLNQTDKFYEEVELRLRSALSPHSATGYEINFRCLKSPKAYSEIVRWNGPLGSFTYIKRGEGAQFGVANGDVVKATIVGNVITVYLNGVQTLQATDDTFKSGSPGVGFYIEGATGVNADFGFSNFAATDELTH